MRESAMPSPDESKAAGKIEFYGGYEVYDENGIDLTLLRRNLQRPAEERLTWNARAASLAQAFWEAGQRRLKSQTNSPWSTTLIDAGPIIRQLEKHHVEYVVIGGLAMVAQGSAHITKDLDLCYGRTAANLQALVAALTPIHPYLRGAPPGLPFRFDVLTLQAGLNFTLTTDHGDLDLLGEVSGVGGYDQTLAQSIELEMFGLKIHVLSIDGLISAKTAAGRQKDRNHLLELEAMKKLRDADLPP
jgi:hypothetical protein